MAVFAFLIIYLLCRLVHLRHDERLPTLPLASLCGLLAIAALLCSTSMIMWALLLPLTLLGFWGAERLLPARGLNEWRLIGLLLVLLPALVLQSSVPAGPLLTWLLTSTGLTPQALHNAAWILLGFLLVAHEANLPIRSLLRWSGLAPRHADTDETCDTVIDRQEYNAGRMIGLMERWLMYAVLVAAQNYNVIAFVLAAKGFARFRQMDQRAFAEYVLIGTLASTLFTVLISLLILRMIAPV